MANQESHRKERSKRGQPNFKKSSVVSISISQDETTKTPHLREDIEVTKRQLTICQILQPVKIISTDK